MQKTPEELDGAARKIVDAMIRNLKEGVARDAPRIEKIKEELRRKHLEKKAGESSRTTGPKES